MNSSSVSSNPAQDFSHALPSENMVSRRVRLPSSLSQQSDYLGRRESISTDASITANLDQLLVALQTLRSSKTSEPSERDFQVTVGGQPQLEAALVEQLTQLELSNNSSPTSPLSREESIASMASSLNIAVTPGQTLVGSLPFKATNISASQHVPSITPNLGHVPGAEVAAAAAAQALNLSLQPDTPIGTNHPTICTEQLLSGLTSVPQGITLPVQQVQPLMPAAHPLLLGATAQGPQVAQYLQQQQLLQLQLQQVQREECLVGLHGQYQSYCQQIISDDINYLANSLLYKLKLLQQGDPNQSMWAKRFFCSIKEVSKVVHRAKCLIVAPDVKPNAAAHINPVRMLLQVLGAAQAYGVPVVFALSRRGIGQVFGREKSMSIVAVMSDDQCEQDCLRLLQLAQQVGQVHPWISIPGPALCAICHCNTPRCVYLQGRQAFMLHRRLVQTALPAAYQTSLFNQGFF